MTRTGILALPLIGLATLVGSCSNSQDHSFASACLSAETPAMRYVAGGTFVMGEDPERPEEGPPREVRVPGFWIDTHEVTNAQFTKFVEATDYRTMAERDPPPLEGAPPEMMQPGSAVFTAPSAENPTWWRWVVGAEWRRPEGPESTVEGHETDPVVQIAYDDALAYAKWAGKALPTEAQWEYAARAGQPTVPEPRDAKGKPTANFYQGAFPARNMNEDGYLGRAPVGCFPPNPLGLYDMIGNVWEWTSDTGGGGDQNRVIKGGSYLCASNYCARYRPAARQYQERGLGTDHIGFRLVDNSRPAPDG